jgi:hypothetical protein
MATLTYVQHYADHTSRLVRRAKRQGRRPQRKYVKFLLRIPAEHYALMQWKNDQCDGALSVTEQIRQAVRLSLCGAVYTQLLNN